MILLHKNDGFKWYELLECYFKGYFYDEDISHDQVMKDLLKLNTKEEFKSYLKKINGEFAMLRESEDFIVAAVDSTRAFPLFFAEQADDFIISDSTKGIDKLLGKKNIDKVAIGEFRISGSCFGNRTLFEEIKSLGSGELLFYDKKNKTYQVEEYMEFDSLKPSDKSAEELLQEMDQMYTQVIDKVMKPLKDRTVVIALDTSWWPRLLISKVKELGYKNVILYSYGGINDENILKCQKMADYLSLPWNYIEYRGIDWFKWFNGKDYDDLEAYASNFVTVPDLEEYLALLTMKEKGMIPEDAVLINSCKTEVLRGGLLPKIFLYPDKINDDVIKSEIAREIASNIKWTSKNISYTDKFMDDIFAHVDTEKVKRNSKIWRFKYAYWKERVGKYYSSSLRSYEKIGFVWRNIQLDSSILDFWFRVPNHMRYSQTLQAMYDEKYQKDLLEHAGIEGVKELKEDRLHMMDWIRLKFPILYRNINFRKKSNQLENAYDDDPLLWYNIISRRHFDRLKTSVTSIIGIQTLVYLRKFFIKYDLNKQEENNGRS